MLFTKDHEQRAEREPNSFRRARGGSGRRDYSASQLNVDVCFVALDLPARERDALGDTLNADERGRAARFRFPRDRDRFIACRGWLRRVLGSYCGRPPEGLVFAYGPGGKPALAGEPADGLRFNLAHAAGHALLAVTRGRELGVDIEAEDRTVEWEGVARRFFAFETAAILERPETERRRAFLACWTRKEAYVKARGVGLALLEGFQVSVDPDEARPAFMILSDPAEASRWSLHSLRPAPGFIAAVAVEARAVRLRMADVESTLRERAAIPAADDRGVHPHQRQRAR